VKLKLKQNLSKVILAGVFLLLIVISTISSDDFLQSVNLFNILRQCSIFGVLVIGETLVILTGGIDLSVGSTLALACILVAVFMPLGMWLAIILSVGASTLMGLFSGFVISKLKVPPFIATLGMLGIAKGIALTITNSEPVKIVDKQFFTLAYGNIGPFPLPFVIFVLLALVFAYFLRFRRCGRYIYAIGSSEEAARVAGIDTDRIKMMVYVISGFMAGIAGVIAASRLTAGTPNMGDGYDLNTISAVVIGGTSLFGGKGSIEGSIIGILIFALMANYMNLVGINPYFQDVVKGLIILIAVYAYSFGFAGDIKTQE